MAPSGRVRRMIVSLHLWHSWHFSARGILKAGLAVPSRIDKLAGFSRREGKAKEMVPGNLRFRLTRIMADVANRYPQNVPGRFYVDDQCIDCDLCRETAPANFTRDDDGGHSYVFKQPASPDEESLCKEAMEGCPVEAIGNDGD
jgi:ferredoxin